MQGNPWHASKFNVFNTDFRANKYHIGLRGYDNKNQTVHIDNNYFGRLVKKAPQCSSTPVTANYERPGTNKMVYIDNWNQTNKTEIIEISDNIFEDREVGQYLGLHLHEVQNSPVSADDSFDLATTLSNIYVKKSQNLSFNGSSTFNIQLKEDETGIKMVDNDWIEVDDYTIQNVQDDGGTGIYMESMDLNGNLSSSQKTRIQNCDIQNTENGIVYYNNQVDNNAPVTLIDKNIISNNQYGIVAAPSEHPINNNLNANSSTNTMNLEITCNDIQNNEIGILGCGDLIDQGTASNNAGNDFDEQTGTSKNTEWDILWQYPVPGGGTDAFIYYYHPFRPNLSGTNNSPYTMNGNTQSGSDFNRDNSPSSLGCYNNLIVMPSSMKDKPVSDDSPTVTVFPNPFEEEVQVKMETATEARIKVTNLHGKQVLDKRISGQNATLKTAEWQPGPYFITIRQNGKTLQRKKLLKID